PFVPTLGFQTMTLYLLGRLDTARERAAETVARARQLGRAYELGVALSHLGRCADLHEPERLFADAEELDRISEEHGFPVFRATAMSQRGCALVRTGRFEEAIPVFRESMARFSATGLSLAPDGLVWLATAQLQGGALDDAETTLEAALAAGREERVWRPRALRLRGELLARRGDAAGAEASYREAIAE